MSEANAKTNLTIEIVTASIAKNQLEKIVNSINFFKKTIYNQTYVILC